MSTLRRDGGSVIVARIVRRFKVNGSLRELARIMEAPALPTRGMVIDFGDGTGEAAVAFVKLNLRPVEFVPGFYPTGVQIHTESEPGDRLEHAEAAGWRPVE